MPLTLAAIETEAVARTPALYAANPAAYSGGAPWVALAGAARKALADAQIAPADPSAPGDADLAALPAARYDRFVDVLRLEALRDAAGSPAAPMGAREAFASLEVYCRNVYGYGLGTLQAGAISMGTDGDPCRRGPTCEF